MEARTHLPLCGSTASPAKSTTAPAPAASATRMTVPALPGSATATRTAASWAAAQRVGRRLPERGADCHDALRGCGLGQAGGGAVGDQGYPDAGSRPQLRMPGSGAFGEE